MPKVPTESGPSQRFDPIARPSNNERLIRPDVPERTGRQDRAQDRTDIGDLYVMRRPQVVRISSDDGHVISDMEEVLDDEDEDEDDEEDDEDEDEDEDDDEDSLHNVDRSEMRDETQEPRPPATAYLLRVSIVTAGPPRITRILRVPSNLTFHQFHGVIQDAFDWDNMHAYRFQVHKVGDSPRHGEVLDMPFPLQRDGEKSGSERKKLSDIFGKPGESMAATYTFDFGDNWLHTIHLLGVADKSLAIGMGIDQEIFCLAGEGSPAVGDCGGAGGWENLKVRVRSIASCHTRAYSMFRCCLRSRTRPIPRRGRRGFGKYQAGGHLSRTSGIWKQ